MATSNIDPEKGFASSAAASATSPQSISAPDDKLVNQHTSRESPLHTFRLLVGLSPPPAKSRRHLAGGHKPKRWHNKGLYHRAKAQERASRRSFLATSFISNTLYLLQILLAATFTALSAYKDANRVGLTVLGAANTVVAGCLAWQKGQGVPMRYRKAQDQYQSLLLDIESAERAFMAAEYQHGSPSEPGGPPHPGSDTADNLDENGGTNKKNNILPHLLLNPYAEKDRLQKLYDEAKIEQQANYPDLYVSTGGVGGGTTAAASATASAGASEKELKEEENKKVDALAKQLEDARAEAARQLETARQEAGKVQAELMRKIEEMVVRVEGNVARRVEGAVDGVGR